jgi:hypothetical protein
MARIRPQGGFRADLHAPLVYALEHFDPSTQTAHKADIFTERVVARRTPRLGADSRRRPGDLPRPARAWSTSRSSPACSAWTATPPAPAWDLVFDDPTRSWALTATTRSSYHRRRVPVGQRAGHAAAGQQSPRTTRGSPATSPRFRGHPG